jgi:hypothetical protein
MAKTVFTAAVAAQEFPRAARRCGRARRSLFFSLDGASGRFDYSDEPEQSPSPTTIRAQTEMESPMKPWSTIVLLLALTVVGNAVAQTGPPIAPDSVPVQTNSPQRDGPFRLLAAARAHANRRRAQGYHADIVKERRFWWVICYR